MDRLSEEGRTVDLRTAALLPLEKRDRVLPLRSEDVEEKEDRVRPELEIRRLLYDRGSEERVRFSDRTEGVEFLRVFECRPEVLESLLR